MTDRENSASRINTLKRTFRLVRRHWFRTLAGAFFLLLLFVYLGFKYVLTESFVRSRILPMGVRGLRHDIEVDEIRGGLFKGFVATGVRIKDPIDLGSGDHITVRQARVKPDWLALIRGRFVIRSIDCDGVVVLFRKTPEGHGNWMPDPRYPQLQGKPEADPFSITNLNVSDFEYRFEDEASGFTTVMKTRNFFGSLHSDENVVITVEGGWQTEMVVFGRPERRQHIPGFACEGVIASDTRGKRTTIRVRAFRGDQEVVADGLYNWQDSKSYVKFELRDGIADLDGEFFRSLFPGFLPLEGRIQYAGTIYRGGQQTRIQIDAFSEIGRIDRPGFENRPFREVHHRTEFLETPQISRLVWTATGSIHTRPEPEAPSLPFRTVLAYSPREDRLALRQLNIASPDAVFDASGFVWFPEDRPASLGLEGRGAVELASETFRDFFSGIPMDASMSFNVRFEGTTESPLVAVNSRAPRLQLTPPWIDAQMEFSQFENAQTVEWTGKEHVTLDGTFTSQSASWRVKDGSGRQLPPFRAEHRLLCDFSRDGWELTFLNVRFPKSEIGLPYPVWLSPVPENVHFQGKGDVDEIAEILNVHPPLEIDADVSFEGQWRETGDGRSLSVSAESPRVTFATGPVEPVCALESANLSTYLVPAFADGMSATFELGAKRVDLAMLKPGRLALGESQLLTHVKFPTDSSTVDIENVTFTSGGWVIGATPHETKKDALPRNWAVAARGDLEPLIDLLGEQHDWRATGFIHVAGDLAKTDDGVAFEGNWEGDLIGITSPEQRTLIGLRGASGSHRFSYQSQQGLTLRSRVEADYSLVRAGTRETILGRADGGAEVRWLIPHGRLDLDGVWFENDRMRCDLTGETATGKDGPASHFQFQIAGPLDVLWSVAQAQSATASVSPGTGNLRLEGEIWREGERGRATFHVTGEELWIDSLTAGAGLVSSERRDVVWNWDGTVELEKVTRGELVSTDHFYHIHRSDDRLWVDEARCTVGGGEVAAVVTVRFGSPEPSFSGAVWVDDSDLAAWTPSFVADATGAVGGIASATAVWSATGRETAQLRQSLQADIDASLRDGYFRRTKVTRSISSLLGLDELQNVDVHNAHAHAEVEGERLHLEKAYLFTNRYRAEIEGTLDFDGSQDLRMILNLPIPLAKRIPDLGGIEKIFPKEVPIALKATGTVRDPEVSVVKYSLIGRPLEALGDAMKSLGRFFRFSGGTDGDPEQEPGG